MPAGYIADICAALIIALLLTRAWLPITLMAVLIWTLLTLGDLEKIIAMGSTGNLEDLRYLFDLNFIKATLASYKTEMLAFAALLISIPVLLVALSARFTQEQESWTAKGVRLTLALILLAAQLPALSSAGAQPWRFNNLFFLHVNELIATIASDNRETPVPLKAIPPELAGLMTADLNGARRDVGQARNVLILVLEGIPGIYVDSVAEYFGVEQPVAMPELSSIARQGMLVPNFLTHKQQTLRGLYAILCADYPKLLGGTPKAIELLSNPEWAQRCLPNILSDRGYQTAFIQAASLEFMSKNTVMPAVGFSQVLGREAFSLDENANAWGPSDQGFLMQTLPMLARLQNGDQPWAAMMLTVGTHHPYEATPEEVQQHGSAKFAAVRRLDAAVGNFIRELENSGLTEDTLVLITSDESHGVAEHPHGQSWGLMIALAPDIEPGINPGVYGTVDTTVSIMDYLAQPIEPTQLGRSLFRDYPDDRFLPFAVGSDISVTSVKGEFHICKSTGKSITNRLDGERNCTRYAADNREMFAAGYQASAGEDSQHSVDRLVIAQSILDTSAQLGSDTGNSRLVLASESQLPIAAGSTRSLMDGQYIDLEANRHARINIEFEIPGNTGTELGPANITHAWSALSGTDDTSVTLNEFVLSALSPGQKIRISCDMETTAALNQLQVSMQAVAYKTDTLIQVTNYSIESSPSAAGAGSECEFDQASMVDWWSETKLPSVTLEDGIPRILTAEPRLIDQGTVDLRDDTNYQTYTLDQGWWGLESWAIWSKKHSNLFFLAEQPHHDLSLQLNMVAYPTPDGGRRQALLKINGDESGRWEVDDVTSPFKTYNTRIPASSLKNGLNRIELISLQDGVSPKSLGRSNDARPLAFGVRNVLLETID